MLYRVIVRGAVMVWVLFSWQVIASQEIPISTFLDLIERQRISDEQIRSYTKGSAIEGPLRRAREQQRVYVIRKLLEARDPDGDTPLLSAVQGNNQELAQTLLDAGANPNDPNGKKLVGVMVLHQGYRFHNRFPLAVAALETKNPQMVKLLLDGGAFDPNYKKEVADRLATTVFKCKVYGRNGGQERADLKEIESLLLLAARQRLLADTFRCNTKQQDKESQDKEQCAHQDREQDAQQDAGQDGGSGDVPVPEPGEPDQQQQSWWQSHCILS